MLCEHGGELRRKHINLEGITALGVDEMQWGWGYRYITVVYQINEGTQRLLWTGEKRTAKTFMNGVVVPWSI